MTSSKCVAGSEHQEVTNRKSTAGSRQQKVSNRSEQVVVPHQEPETDKDSLDLQQRDKQMIDDMNACLTSQNWSKPVHTDSLGPHQVTNRAILTS